VVVFSAVFSSNSVKLTVPWGGARRSNDASRFEPFLTLQTASRTI
jgi:hypothetical protein